MKFLNDDTTTLFTVSAVYIGNGCFIQTENGALAFVTRGKARPEWLAEGGRYELIYDASTSRYSVQRPLPSVVQHVPWGKKDGVK